MSIKSLPQVSAFSGRPCVPASLCARDYCDMVLEELALSEAGLLERAGEPEADRDAYRMLAQQAIHQRHAVTQRLCRLRAQHCRLIDEYRTLRRDRTGGQPSSLCLGVEKAGSLSSWREWLGALGSDVSRRRDGVGWS